MLFFYKSSVCTDVNSLIIHCLLINDQPKALINMQTLLSLNIEIRKLNSMAYI